MILAHLDILLYSFIIISSLVLLAISINWVYVISLDRLVMTIDIAIDY
uniref:Uncharacterized protein n=1 Tax=Rhizophora mucronata TaxID=61149 RepID=A0A2P2PU68_RHIMU